MTLLVTLVTFEQVFPCDDRELVEGYGVKDGVLMKKNESVSTKYLGTMLTIVLESNDHIKEQVQLQASASRGAH